MNDTVTKNHLALEKMLHQHQIVQRVELMQQMPEHQLGPEGLELLHELLVVGFPVIQNPPHFF
jgi:hypothetical protein